MTVRRADLTVRVQPEPKPAELVAILVALRRHRARKSFVVDAAPVPGRWRRLGSIAGTWRATVGWREAARFEGAGSAHRMP